MTDAGHRGGKGIFRAEFAETLRVLRARPLYLGTRQLFRFDTDWIMDFHYAMQITIDKLGRIVVPKPIRDRYHLRSGTVLELEPETDGIRISVVGARDSLISKQGILVHHGTTVVDLDIADFINAERVMRNGAFFSEHP